MNEFTSRQCLPVLTVIAMVCGSLSIGSSDVDSAEPAKPIQVVLLSGQNNHDWRRTTPKIKALLEATGRFKVVVNERPDHLTEERLEPFDVVVSNWNSWGKDNDQGKDSSWSDSVKKAYVDFVRRGGGHVVVHAGSSSFPNWNDYLELTLATWKLGQTGHGPRHEFSVRMDDVEHPVTRGLTPFAIYGELWHGAGMQDGVTVLASALSDRQKGGSGRTEPLAMVKRFGQGRSFTLLLGHAVDEMENPGFVALLVRGTEWAATGNVTVSDPNLNTEDERQPAPQFAETVLLYQRDTGGWPKNYDRQQDLTEQERKGLVADKSKADSTIDNGATHTEIRLLSDAYHKTQDMRLKEAALRGVEYLLNAQYDNGGWPQRYPKAEGYAKHITFNDNAMIGVMSLLRNIAEDDDRFSFVPQDTRNRCAEAVQRGIRCILKCQVIVDGRPTAWCAQHDEATFEPRKARSYELASLSGSESVGIVRFLMGIDDPDEEVVRSIEAAVAWFELAKLKGVKQIRVEDASLPKGYDRIVVADPDAPPMWARFYDIDSNKPVFCSRDGIPKSTLAEISYERRNGYSWIGYYAEELLAQELPAWRKRLE